jgi:hypothetical protein
MSDLESKQRGIRFEPVVGRPAPIPGNATLLAGVIWPAAVIAIELVTRMCAEAFFDPMPSVWHTLAVILVPVTNLLLLLRLWQPPGEGEGPRAADRWPAADLAAHLARQLGDAPRPILQRTLLAPDAKAGVDMRKGSDHIARLWARERVDALLRAKGSGRADAVALAVQHRLVTPVSGVVVLETKQQYDESRLTPVSAATVPTIPEPHEWALMLMACLAVGWLAWRSRRQRALVG